MEFELGRLEKGRGAGVTGHDPEQELRPGALAFDLQTGLGQTPADASASVIGLHDERLDLRLNEPDDRTVRYRGR